MKKVTPLTIRLVTLLVLLALLAYLVYHRNGLTAEEAEDEAVVEVVKVEHTVVRDHHVAVAFLALTALFAFLTWTALRASEGEDKAVPPASESSASDKRAFR